MVSLIESTINGTSRKWRNTKSGSHQTAINSENKGKEKENLSSSHPRTRKITIKGHVLSTQRYPQKDNSTS